MKKSYPVTDEDRKRLKELAEELGSWADVSRALGFRGVATARRWALTPGSTFKGRDYPQRIKDLHEEVFGRVDARQLVAIEHRLEEMAARLEELTKLIA